MAEAAGVLDHSPEPSEDYYAILGCDDNSTVEQIQAEYRVRALQLHPDKGETDNTRFQQLQDAKETLCDPERRALYDKWKSSGLVIPYKKWLSMKDHVQQTMHWATPKTKDRMLPGGGSPGKHLNTGNAAARRASEGGAAHWGRWSGQGGQEPPPEVVSKFRNYEI